MPICTDKHFLSKVFRVVMVTRQVNSEVVDRAFVLGYDLPDPLGFVSCRGQLGRVVLNENARIQALSGLRHTKERKGLRRRVVLAQGSEMTSQNTREYACERLKVCSGNSR